MDFQTNQLYHIFNQGNNRQKIFFTRNNYHFFLNKIQDYILPYGDLLAWCLMPNHFHLMVHLKTEKIRQKNGKERSFNDSIGIMLRSYTRAINVEINRSGSLFREETKAACLSEPKSIKNNWYKTGRIRETILENPEMDYPNICFKYILLNPLKAGLVTTPGNWEYSSFNEVVGNMPARTINMSKIKEFELNFHFSDGVTQSHPVRNRKPKKK